MNEPRITALSVRYARALKDAGDESGTATPEEIQADLIQLKGLWDASSDLRCVLGNSSISAAWRVDLYCELAGLKAQSITGKLAEILVRSKRLPLLPSILAAWHALRREIAGITAVMVEIPMPMPADFQPSLIKRLENIFRGPVELETNINPALLGGIVLRAQGRMMDGSLHGRLDDLRRHLLDEQLLTA